MGLLQTATTALTTVGERVVAPAVTALDQRLVVPRLGEGSPVHRVLATVAAVAASGGSHPAHDDASAYEDEPAHEDGTAYEPDAPLRPEQQDEVEELVEELLEDQRDERFVGELADEEIRRVQAEVRAKQLLEDPEHP